MQRLKPVDVVIVGGGFVGLLLAKEIASRTSLSVVVLERGGPRKTSEYADGMDEVDHSLRYRMMQNLSEETVTHRHSSSETAVPVRQYGSFNPGTGVGGAGEHWGAISYRFLPEVFTLKTHLHEKHGAAKLPAGLAVQDWGLTYDEIEPYYWRAEQMMGVVGKAGNLGGRKIEGGNIFEGPRSHEYPVPPHPATHFTGEFRKGVLELGYHPYPIPTATLSQPYMNPDGITRPGCAYCGYCTRYGCMIGAKAQPTNTLLPLLERRKNFTLRTGCHVRRVIHRNGQAEGVSCIDERGNEVTQPAHTVMLASYTLNNNRLLMLSKIGEQYNPATGKGTLGKNLTHQVGAGLEVFFDKPLKNYMGAGGMGFGIGDWDGDFGRNENSGVLRGGTIRVASSGEGPIGSFGRTPPGDQKREWGSAWKKDALKWWDHSAALAMEAEHLSYRQNYFDLDPAYTDKFGDPLLRLTLNWTDHERHQAADSLKIQTSIAKAMGVRIGGTTRGIGVRYSVVYYQSTHVQGGVMMGSSPETSVVNRWLQHWQVPNVWAIAGSAFPQNASGNPTLTVLALAYRAADAFIEKYTKRPGLVG
jgi:gluconate 2-dehydrogenase alpha chain